MTAALKLSTAEATQRKNMAASVLGFAWIRAQYPKYEITQFIAAHLLKYFFSMNVLGHEPVAHPAETTGKEKF